MGAIEISFILLFLIFGIVGLVRGFHRELGVTILLLLTLFVMLLLDQQFPATRKQIFEFIAGVNVADQAVAKTLVYSAFLVMMIFVSYHGETLSFPSAARNPTLSLLAGLLNGYLFAGSLWYYLAEAHWPFINVTAPFSSFYYAAMRLLPPTILDWRYVIALVTILLILRVWK